MSDNLEPRPGDVWESPRGTIVFVYKSGSGFLSAIEKYGGSVDLCNFDWSGYTLRFRDGQPVPQPQPDGETVTVECAVMHRNDERGYGVFGQQGQTAVETAMHRDGSHFRSFSVVIPLSVPVLPTVEVKP